MPLSAEEKEQVEQIVEQMIAEYRAKPTQEKEDGLGLELANLPPEQREYVTTVLLRTVAAETARGNPGVAGKAPRMSTGLNDALAERGEKDQAR